ncbi:MAG: RadC family protein [Candidatus Izemoplasmataceae bacterium]|uniref:RadC family protein n=1 Tax=Liberiplasma polymorphum TaxID=3374570 RepID=UPI003771E041
MYLIKEMPYKERPRERFMHYGKEALSNHELIAIILRTGTKDLSVIEVSKNVLYKYASLKAVNQTSVKELSRLKGMGTVKAIQLLAALELGKRLQEESFNHSIALTNPKYVFDYLKTDLEMLNQEMFYALYLDIKGKLIKKQLLFMGSLSSAIVHPREVFKHAVTLSAASIIIVHNHPSGDPTPSNSDIKITKMMVENGKVMDIEVVDHIIIGKGRYYSFREHKQF